MLIYVSFIWYDKRNKRSCYEKKGLFFPGFVLILTVSLFAVSGYGYIQNIIHLVNLTPFVFEAKSIIGIGGVFIPPVGIIMGLFVW